MDILDVYGKFEFCIEFVPPGWLFEAIIVGRFDSAERLRT
jgi:hypothetical protein